MMTRQERAKQFMPFDAMKGLQEALREREEKHSRVMRRERSEEMLSELTLEVSKLERGDKIEVLYYHAFHELSRTGVVEKIDTVYHYILLDGVKISFDDIYELKIV